ncbi:hypothetical protein B0H14DRAFT_3494392 [Mycena olivaceomarginata]|nr:hypothetical protein B0H14DRAFT_3494392 [Mycena olivaceomarginata]
MTVTAQYARQTNCHAPPFAVPPSHEAAMKSCGPDDHDPGRTAMIRGSALLLLRTWGALVVQLRRRVQERSGRIRVPHARAVRVPSAASPRGIAKPLLVLPAEYSSSRCLSGLRLPTRVANPHREHQRDTHESTPAAIDAAFSHTGRFQFMASHLTAAHFLTAHPFHRPSSTPSTPTALERRKRRAPRLPALLAARALQRDGSTYDLRHALKAATRYAGAIACATPYHVHTLNTVPGRTHPSPSLAPPVARAARFLAAHAAIIASSRTATLHAHAVLHGTTGTTSRLCSACPGCSPSLAPPLSPPHALSSSKEQDSTRPRARFRASPTRHRLPQTCSAHAAAAPHHLDHLPGASSASPPSDGSQLLSGAGSAMRSTTGMLSECGGRSPTPNAGLIAFPDAPPCNGIPARASSALHLLLSGTSTHRGRLIHSCGAEPSGRRMPPSKQDGHLELAPLSTRLAGGEHWGRGAWSVERAGVGVGTGARKRLVESGHRCVGAPGRYPFWSPA